MIANALAEVLAAAIAIVASATAAGARFVKSNRDRVEDVESELELDEDGPTRLDQHEAQLEEIESRTERIDRYFLGDADDPAQSGILEDIHEIKEQLDDD